MVPRAARRHPRWRSRLRTLIPAFFHRQDCGDTMDNIVRFLNSFFRHRGVRVSFGFGHVFHRTDHLADLINAPLGEIVLRSYRFKCGEQHPDDFRNISK